MRIARRPAAAATTRTSASPMPQAATFGSQGGPGSEGGAPFERASGSKGKPMTNAAMASQSQRMTHPFIWAAASARIG